MTIRRRICLVLALLLVVGAPLMAQTQPPATEGFVPLSEFAEREVLPATPLVFYAYAFVWVAILFYLWSLWRRMARIEEDLQAVRRRVDAQEGR